jgi:hypothetical protein
MFLHFFVELEYSEDWSQPDKIAAVKIYFLFSYVQGPMTAV